MRRNNSIIDLSGRIKHEVAKGVVRSALKDAGYRVISSGMESVFREVALLGRTQYKRFDLAKAFRQLPDFFVAEWDMTKQQAVEVKYRSELKPAPRPGKMPELIDRLCYQVNHFGPFTLVLMHGNPPQTAQEVLDPDFYIKTCRVRPKNGGEVQLRPVAGQNPWQPLASMKATYLWSRMRPLQSNFPAIEMQPAKAMIEDLVRALA